MTIRRTVSSTPLEALVALVRALVAYAQRYAISSADFSARYQRGELGDAEAMLEWAGDYQHSLQLQAELEQQLVARDDSP